MSVSRLFNISAQSLRATKAEIETTGQNIANANSEGYDRRRISLQSTSVASSGLYANPDGQATGTGVAATSYERVRNQLLDTAAAEAQSGESGAREEARLLSVLEGSLAPDTEAGLQESLGKLSDAFSEVARNPEDSGARNALLGQAQQVAQTFQETDNGLSRLRGDAAQALSESIDEANRLIRKVASLNQTVRETEASGSPDLSAKDRRDKALKELSSLLPTDIREDAKAGLTVTVDGVDVVQGAETTTLKQTGSAGDRLGTATVEFGDTGVKLKGGEEGRGEIGAQLRVLNDTLPEVRENLDDLAKRLVKQVNEKHSDGANLDNETNLNFFEGPSPPSPSISDPAYDSVKASNIELSDELKSGGSLDPDKIAANGFTDDPTTPATVDQLLLGDTSPAQGAKEAVEGLESKATDLIASVGGRLSRATAREESEGAIVDRLESASEGVSGVSLDEELAGLIEEQQAFQASARVLQTAQEVTDTLLSTAR